MELRELGCVAEDWSQWAEDRVQWLLCIMHQTFGFHIARSKSTELDLLIPSRYFLCSQTYI